MKRLNQKYARRIEMIDTKRQSDTACGPGQTGPENRGRMMCNRYILIISIALAVAGCSADANGNNAGNGGFNPGAGAAPAPTTGGNAGSPPPASAGATRSTGLAECEPRGGTIDCYCQNGEQRTQRCNAMGQLEECECPSEEEMKKGTENAALCVDLQNMIDCEDPVPHVSEQRPTSILFVIDRSGSMVCNTPTDGQTSEQCEAEPITMFPDLPTKWDITREALKQAFDKLGFNEKVNVGLTFFSNDGYCGVTSDPLLGGVLVQPMNDAQLNLLKATLDVIEPEGGTPIVGATILAYKHLHLRWREGCPDPPCGAPGNRFVVLITDGEDSCPDPRLESGPAPCGSGGIACTHYLLDSEVPKALSVNIRTFVIGAPGSEPARGFLSELAFQGNKGGNDTCAHGDRDGTTGDCHYDMTQTQDFATDLSSALAAISGEALGCEYPVPEPIEVSRWQDALVNVQYSLPEQAPVCFERTDPGTCESGANGWQFATGPEGNVDLSKVLLCGEACDIIEANDAAQVDVVMGCTPLIIE